MKKKTKRFHLKVVYKNFMSFLFALDSGSDPDDDELRRLEELYQDISDEVEDAGMDEIIDQLQKRLEEQEKTKQAYDAELEKLRADIANLQDINSAVPRTCSRDDALEQP